MNKILTAIIATTLFSTSSTFAYECLGKVNTLVIDPSGTVTASIGNINWVYLCKVNTTHNGIAPDSCKTIYSALLAARLSDRNVRM